MACLLPFRPWLSPDLRVFSFGAPRRFRILIVGRLLSCTSTPPQRLNFLRAAHLPVSHADHDPLSVSTSLCAFRPYSICGPGSPFFSPSCDGVPPALPCQQEVPLGGFGYPFSGLLVPRPWEAFFSPQRSWASPFRAFLRPGDPRPVSRSPLRPRAFPQNPSALYRRLGGLLPPGQPYP
jgi:hypothetical protein